MGFRKGYQTAMLVEPIRLALFLAREWQMPIVVACTDAEAAFVFDRANQNRFTEEKSDHC